MSDSGAPDRCGAPHPEVPLDSWRAPFIGSPCLLPKDHSGVHSCEVGVIWGDPKRPTMGDVAKLAETLADELGDEGGGVEIEAVAEDGTRRVWKIGADDPEATGE